MQVSQGIIFGCMLLLQCCILHANHMLDSCSFRATMTSGSAQYHTRMCERSRGTNQVSCEGCGFVGLVSVGVFYAKEPECICKACVSAEDHRHPPALHIIKPSTLLLCTRPGNTSSKADRALARGIYAMLADAGE